MLPSRRPNSSNLKMKLEGKTLECETELAANEVLRRELREAVASKREAIISAQTSSIAELQTKLNDEEAPCIPFPAERESELHVSLGFCLRVSNCYGTHILPTGRKGRV